MSAAGCSLGGRHRWESRRVIARCGFSTCALWPRPGSVTVGTPSRADCSSVFIVHCVVLAAGQGHRGPGSGQQLRHVGCPDGERARIHRQPPPAVLFPQAGLHGRIGSGQQAGQARDAQVAGDGLLPRGEPGRRAVCRGLRTVQVLLGPDDLDPQPDHRLHRHIERAAGQGQADDAAERMSQHEGAGTGADDIGDRGSQGIEGVARQRLRAAMTRQVRRQPAAWPPPGEQRPPPLPYVAGSAQAVQQQQNRLPGAALVNPQASSHTPQSGTAQSPAERLTRARRTPIAPPRGTAAQAVVPDRLHRTLSAATATAATTVLRGRSWQQSHALSHARLEVWCADLHAIAHLQ